jgi:hypothetical protein
VTRRLARIGLSLYPLAFRRRYGEEMRELLEERPATLLMVLDLWRGALLAHVRPPPGIAEQLDAADRVRASASGVLACWVAFAAAGAWFANTTEDGPFSVAGYHHLLLSGSHEVVQLLAIVASALVLAGAAPLIVAALAEARRQPALRPVVGLPPLAVLLFAGLTGLLVALAHSEHSQRPATLGGLAVMAWALAGLGCGAVCVVASRRALFAVHVSRGRLLRAYACGALLTAAMAAITLAVCLYAIALMVDSAHLAGSANGPLQLISTSASLVVQMTVMAAATVLAWTSAGRGWNAAGQLRV